MVGFGDWLLPRRNHRGFLRFTRLTSYHTWGAKTAAALVGAALFVFFANGPGWVFRIVMPVVVLTNLEEIAITLTLIQLTANVPSVWHALKLRRRPTLQPEPELISLPNPANVDARRQKAAEINPG